MKNTTAIIVGVGVGVVISAIGIGCYYYYRYKKKTIEKEKMAEEKTEDLLKRKEHFDKLNSSDIVEWFNDNASEAETSCVVARPIKRVLEGLGCKSDKSIYGDNTLIQMIYDGESKKATKIRLIEYDNIDTNLETQIDEKDGFMVVTL